MSDQTIEDYNISYYYNKSVELAVARVKELAMKVLNSNDNLDGFEMGMRTYFFIGNDGENKDPHHDIVCDTSALADLNKFIRDWVYKLRLTGENVSIKRGDNLI